jgi:hypothetical protein
MELQEDTLSQEVLDEIKQICIESDSEDEAFNEIMSNYSIDEDRTNSFIKKYFYGRVQESSIVHNSKSAHLE